MEDIITLLGTKAFLVFKYAYGQYRQNGNVEDFAKGLHIAFYDEKIANPISIHQDKQRREFIARLTDYVNPL